MLAANSEELFYCARSHYQIIAGTLHKRIFFLVCLGKYSLLEDILPPNARRASVIMATRESN